MTGVAQRLRLRDRELVSIVGAGGKSSLLRTLGGELAVTRPVVLTTTTKMGTDQVSDPAVWSEDPDVISAELSEAQRQGRPLFVANQRIGEKVVGLDEHTVDDLFQSGIADAIVVEADGARRRLIKAPATHEPVIPTLTTTVVVVASARALGRPVSSASHRPDRFAELAGIGVEDPIGVDDAVRVLLHVDGGRKGLPPHARLAYVITPGLDRDETDELAASLSAGAGVAAAFVWRRTDDASAATPPPSD